MATARKAAVMSNTTNATTFNAEKTHNRGIKTGAVATTETQTKICEVPMLPKRIP